MTIPLPEGTTITLASAEFNAIVAERDKLAARVVVLDGELALAEGHAHRADANRHEADARRLRTEAEVASLKSAWAASRADAHDQRARMAEVEAERDLLGRQQKALLDLAQRAEAEHRLIHHDEIYQCVTTDPGDDR